MKTQSGVVEEERKLIETFSAYMKENGWNIEWNETQTEYLPAPIVNRYGKIPKEWLDFIKSVKCMISPDETMWFLCVEDFAIQNNKAFQWNEWELISLESAENNMEWKNKIERFWKNHLPIVMSVKDCYSYYAIDIKDGSIVYGEEPEFEECKIIAGSFTNFIEKILNRELLF